MKAFIPLLALALSLAITPAAAAPEDSLQGVWRNTRNTLHIRVAACGEALCGKVIWAVPQAKEDARRGSGRTLIGTQLFSGLRPSGDRTWKGKIYLPDRDASGSATVVLKDGKTIRVSGCLFLGLACKAQHWHRIG